MSNCLATKTSQMLYAYVIRRRHLQNVVQIHNISKYVRRRPNHNSAQSNPKRYHVSWACRHSLQSGCYAETWRPEDLFDMYSAQACKSAIPSPVAFCPAVHFLGVFVRESFFRVAFCPAALSPGFPDGWCQQNGEVGGQASRPHSWVD